MMTFPNRAPIESLLCSEAVQGSPRKAPSLYLAWLLGLLESAPNLLFRMPPKPPHSGALGTQTLVVRGSTKVSAPQYYVSFPSCPPASLCPRKPPPPPPGPCVPAVTLLQCRSSSCLRFSWPSSSEHFPGATHLLRLQIITGARG